MITLTLAEIAEAVGGRLDLADGSETVTGPVVVDSREVQPGGLFVARVGEVQDGHDYAQHAVKAGATAVLGERSGLGVPMVVVADSELALGQLARAVLDRLADLKVVGVTGSTGKTTTKDLLAQVLEPLGPVVAPAGSFNTEVGVPLTVLTADESTRVLIVEMGARGVGHIAYLCEIAPPHVGVVLNVGSAHVGEFGDRETTARAKGELVDALPDTGTAVLNADDQLVRAMADRTGADVLMVGESVHADIRAEQIAVNPRGQASFNLVTPDGQDRVELRLVGEHHVHNVLAAAGVAHTLGMPVADVARLLSAATPRSRWRMEVVERPDGVKIINDAYNANPESMRAALRSLAHLGAAHTTWAVLGEMLELGQRSAAEHQSLGRHAAELGISRIIAVGEGARGIQQGAAGESDWPGVATFAAGADDALAMVQGEIRPGDVVLVKASRATGLEKLAEALVQLTTESDSAT